MSSLRSGSLSTEAEDRPAGLVAMLSLDMDWIDLENAIIEYYLCPPSASMTFEEVFVDYCKYCKAHNVIANKTVDNYESDYNKYIAPLPLVKYSITKVDEELLIKSLKTIVEQIKLDVKRYANVKTIIRRVFFHARTELNLNCITANNIISELKFPASCFIKREHNEERQIFKLREIQLIKKHLAGTEDLERLAILLVIETGLRLGEVVALKRCDIFKSYIRVSRSEHKEKADNGSIRYFLDLPKKKKIGNVNLTAEAIKLLDKIQSLSDSEFLFPDKNDRSVQGICPSSCEAHPQSHCPQSQHSQQYPIPVQDDNL